MQEKPEIGVKPLQTGRQIYSWFCTDAASDPLNRHQVLARHIFRFIFTTGFIAAGVVVNASLLINYTSVNGIDEPFFELIQLDLSLYGISAAIATFRPKLASLFGHLDSIYKACKALLSCSTFLFKSQKQTKIRVSLDL